MGTVVAPQPIIPPDVGKMRDRARFRESLENRSPSLVITHSAVFLGLFVSLMSSAAATSQCPPEAKCEPLPEEFLVSVAASIAGAKNVCSRIDPSRGSEYAEAANRLVGEDREALIKAQQSALFPKALEAVEVELGATPAEKLARRCAAFLKKK